jgi:ribosomal protein S18 acetylase RimI-like enzyme
MWQGDLMAELPFLDVAIRGAGASDAAQIARVHIRSWREAYAGIVPAEYLEALDEADRASRWEQDLRNGPRDNVRTWIAEAGSKTLGFATLGPSRDEDADRGDVEIYSMYLDPGMWGRGVARELMRTVLADVPAGTPITLWVIADNDRARHFYRRHGFTPDGSERLDEIGGEELLEVRYRRG